ncbi:MAG: S-methyl-5-thioribose-1-phosphate isomerase [Deltaproteobacteria bacterium]|nr:S-methyl-5-thioribose-1-phosphate isomerase [Deltaproteobacteria bacterium]
MRIGGTHYRSIWMEEDSAVINVIDQRKLPFELKVVKLESVKDAYDAIAGMVVRGAPLIGVTAAYGLYLAGLNSDPGNWCEEVKLAGEKLISSRPTAVNLKYAIDLMMDEVNCAGSREGMIDRLFHLSVRLTEDEVIRCRKIGEHGVSLISDLYKKSGRLVNILTHCNAGWLACVDYGTATSPIYLAHEQGIPVHVWVDETRPRNQGARLTAYELGEQGVPHTVIVDNAGGHLMQNGEVDLVIVGSDRTTRTGDVVNKIGTYLKALAARDNDIPFYVALPSSSIDFTMKDGNKIKIENRAETEVSHVEGWSEKSKLTARVRILPETSNVANPGFDITPARLVTKLITEKGISEATEEGIQSLF